MTTTPPTDLTRIIISTLKGTLPTVHIKHKFKSWRLWQAANRCFLHFRPCFGAGAKAVCHRYRWELCHHGISFDSFIVIMKHIMLYCSLRISCTCSRIIMSHGLLMRNGHWNTCECGGKLNEAAHTFAWVTDKEATAAEAGSKHEECTVCGYEKAAVEIPQQGTAEDPSEPPADPISQMTVDRHTTLLRRPATTAILLFGLRLCWLRALP